LETTAGTATWLKLSCDHALTSRVVPTFRELDALTPGRSNRIQSANSVLAIAATTLDSLLLCQSFGRLNCGRLPSSVRNDQLPAMPPRQETFKLIPETVVNNVTPRRPMTSKEAKEAYRNANKIEKLTKAERRRLEAEEIAQQKKDYEKERAAARARAAREKKLQKEAEEREKRKRLGLPEPSRFVRASQPTIKLFVNAKGGSKRTWEEVDLEERSKGAGPIAFGLDSRVGEHLDKQPRASTSPEESDEDEFGDFPSLSQVLLSEGLEGPATTVFASGMISGNALTPPDKQFNVNGSPRITPHAVEAAKGIHGHNRSSPRGHHPASSGCSLPKERLETQKARSENGTPNFRSSARVPFNKSAPSSPHCSSTPRPGIAVSKPTPQRQDRRTPSNSTGSVPDEDHGRPKTEKHGIPPAKYNNTLSPQCVVDKIVTQGLLSQDSGRESLQTPLKDISQTASGSVIHPASRSMLPPGNSFMLTPSAVRPKAEWSSSGNTHGNSTTPVFKKPALSIKHGRRPLQELRQNTISPPTVDFRRPFIKDVIPLDRTNRILAVTKSVGNYLPPPSTMAFLEAHLDDFFPSLTQQVRELTEDIDVEDIPSNTQVAREIESDYSFSATRPLVLLPSPKQSSQSYLCGEATSQHVIVPIPDVSEEDLAPAAGGSKHWRLSSVDHDLGLAEFAQRQPVSQLPHCRPPQPARKGRFFEEKEEDLMAAALEDSLRMANRRESSPTRSERLAKKLKHARDTGCDDDLQDLDDSEADEALMLFFNQLEAESAMDDIGDF
jgi:hypothetical protein